jgi:hypothetical protein
MSGSTSILTQLNIEEIQKQLLLVEKILSSARDYDADDQDKI